MGKRLKESTRPLGGGCLLNGSFFIRILLIHYLLSPLKKKKRKK